MRILKLCLTLPLLIAFVGSLWLTVTHAQPGVQLNAPDGTLRRLRVPILMYHYISDLPAGADSLRRGLTVTPDQFRQHLAFLKSRGYAATSLYEVYLALTQGYPLPPNPLVITFDDGYIDHLISAVPGLLEFGYTGTFFVITDYADNARDGYLNWDQIRQISAAGMEIASHSKTHADLSGRDHDTLVYEILGSLESIQAHIGKPSHSFSYPMGRYDPGTVAVAAQAGVKLAVTTGHGATHTTDSLLELNRLRVQNSTGVAGLDVLLHEK